MFFLCGCVPMLRLDVQCVVRPDSGVLIADCADQQIWKEYQEKAKAKEGL